MTRTVTLGGGIEMPIVGFGTWRLTGNEAYDAVRLALDTGYRHIDTATMYRNEAEVGRAVRDSGLSPDEVFVTTKLPPGLAGRARQTLDESLRLLDLGPVDLWLVHWPPGGADPALWRAFLDARDAGLVRAVGVSNYSIGQLDELTAATGETPLVNQVPWSPMQHDAGVLAASRDRGVVVEGYSSLKRTDLTHPVLVAIAERHGVTVPQVVLRWHLEHGIPVIPKSSHKERMAANLDLFWFALDADEVARVDALAG